MTTSIDNLLKKHELQAGQNGGNNQGKPIDGQDYDVWAQEKRDQGLKLTNIRQNEADFSLYMNSLSEDLKNEITDSFDCEEDYELQAEIAAAFKSNNTNFLHRSDISALCKQNGWTLERVSYSTSYIPDYKAGNFSNSINENGRINVYTISDGKGGSIMIADANGNGGLEIEEVYGNELLNGIVSDIQPGTSAYVKGHNGSGNNEDGTEKTAEDAFNGKISQTFFNAEVEEYINLGYSRNAAVAKAKDELKVTDLTYTGSMKEINEETETNDEAIKEKLDKETEKLFNEAYDKYIQKGETPETAFVFAQQELKAHKIKYPS